MWNNLHQSVENFLHMNYLLSIARMKILSKPVQTLMN
jgi:hypothetical protein